MTMVLLARSDAGKARHLSVKDYLKQCELDPAAVQSMLAAIRYQKPVTFRHNGMLFVVCNDDPQRYEHTYQDMVSEASLDFRELPMLLPDPDAGSGMPVWKVPCTYPIRGTASITVKARSCEDAIAICEREIKRCRQLSRGELWDDPFFDLVERSASEDAEQCHYDQCAEMDGPSVVIDRSLPVLRVDPEDVDLAWQPETTGDED